jgi:predicted flap endonuclease-1-like 5' DNA nuclease/uncharacterized protein YoxC
MKRHSHHLLAGMLVIGLVLGWIFRGDRCAREKMAVNASWQEQLESQQAEHNRLAEQNKSLMEQISQYQASHGDSVNRAKELSDSLRDAFAKRDELQRQVRELRGNLEVAVAQRNRLKNDLASKSARNDATAVAMKDKDDKIFRLSRELTSWQARVPPLVERYQECERVVRELKVELESAHLRIEELEAVPDAGHTQIEAVDRESLPDGLDASNEQYAATASHHVEALQDQVSDDRSSVADAAGNDDDDDSYFDDEELPDADAPQVRDYARDDLQAIKGVGPAIERTLNDLGITRYNQIAEMSEYDIDRVAQQLKGFRSRIYREDWIGQARDLQYRKRNSLS